MSFKQICRKIIAVNQNICRKFDKLLPEIYRLDGNSNFAKTFAPKYINAYLEQNPNDSKLVYDIGGGKNPFLGFPEKEKYSFRYIGLDIDQEELSNAPEGLYDVTVCDSICSYRGSKDADIAICRAVLEHVPDNQTSFAGISSLLKRDGIAIIFVPCRNAAFARINLLLPQKLKEKILYTLFPHMEKDQGFPACYDRCTPADFMKLAQKNGLEVVELKSYMSSSYFTFCAPLHILWRFWQLGFRAIAGNQASETFCLCLKAI